MISSELIKWAEIQENFLIIKNIDFKEINDIEILKSLDIYEVPVLDVDDTLLDFSAANSWINEQ